EEIEALQAERQKTHQVQAKDIEDAKKRNASPKEIRRIEEKHKKVDAGLNAKIEAVRKKHADLEDKVGVFEGAGYASKGLYRPMIYCLMISNPKNEFCRVCERAIARMIDFYSRAD
ncbi:MAG: IgA Peptidase superfamily, partial [Candidatus Aminicenantes bacterium]|nr:IgA Peptidase superfamily [Candidatus Aminicenantes bacterium]